MTREELLERMAKGAEILERDDLTHWERKRYKERYNELERQLKALDAREQYPAKVQEQISKIREILGMDRGNRHAPETSKHLSRM